jgi:hypothetical protein
VEQLRIFTLKHDLLKISVDLQTTFAAETHLAERQWLKEQLFSNTLSSNNNNNNNNNNNCAGQFSFLPR